MNADVDPDYEYAQDALKALDSIDDDELPQKEAARVEMARIVVEELLDGMAERLDEVDA